MDREPLQRQAHGGRLDLEASDRARLAQRGEGLGVAVREGHRLRDPAQRDLDRGEGAIPEEIDLDEPEARERLEIVLGHPHALGSPLERRVEIDPGVGDHHPTRMHREVPGTTDQTLDRGNPGALLRGEELERERLVDLALQLLARQPRGEPGKIGPAHAQRVETLAKRGAAAEGLVRRHHRHALRTEALEHPRQQSVPAMRRHVQVDVREVGARPAQEALEQQTVRDRIHAREPEQVHDQRAHGGAAAHDLEPFRAGVRADLSDDQEHSREPARAHDVELAREPEIIEFAPATSLRPRVHEPTAAATLERVVGSLARGHRDARDDRRRGAQVEPAGLRHDAALRERVGRAGETLLDLPPRR